MHRSLSCLLFASAVALYAAPAHAASVATIDVIASPGEIAPGGSTLVTLVARDSEGYGVPGAAMNVLASAGSATAITDYGNGTYTFVYTAAKDATGVMLVVTTADGNISTSVNLGINSSLKAKSVPQGQAPAATATTTTTKAPKEAKEPRQPREPRANTGSVDAPTARVRVGLGGGTYSYSQVRTPNTDSPLWGDDIYLGGENGEAGPANPLVGEVRVQAWLPQMPYLGVDAHFRLGRHSVSWPGASAAIPDNVPHGTAMVAARYPFMTGSGAQMHIGAKAGLLYGEYITFQTGENDSTLDYPNIPIYSAGFGAEFGAEFGQGYLNLSGVFGLRGGKLYSSNAMAEFGYTIPSMPNVGLAASVQYSDRSIDIVSGSDTDAVLGVLSDTAILATVGPTIAF